MTSETTAAAVSTARSQTIIRALVALSLANLNHLFLWRELIGLSDIQRYFIATLSLVHYATIATSVILLAILAYLVLWALERWQHEHAQLLRCAFLAAALLIPLDFVRIRLDLAMGEILSSAPLLIGVGAVALVGGGLTLARPRIVSTALSVLLLILSPFALINLSQAGWEAVELLSADRGSRTDAPAPSVPRQRGPRVIWLTFDELDQTLAFAQRPADLALPNFSAFAATAFFATRARQAETATLRAMPSMWTGRRVVDSEPRGPSRLNIRYQPEGPFLSLSETAHVFKAASDAGRTVGIVGWYHPYCRLFAGSYRRCRTFRFSTLVPDPDDGVTATALRQLRALWPLWRRQQPIDNYRGILAETKALGTDRSFDFVAVHVPVPHLPAIYDRQREVFGYRSSWTRADYLDNLALTDRFMGELHQAMTVADTWDETIVVVIGDTHWKGWGGGRNELVPLLIKFAGQSAPFTYDTPFTMTLMRGLLLALLTGEVATPEQTAAWLDARRQSN